MGNGQLAKKQEASKVSGCHGINDLLPIYLPAGNF